MLDNKQLFLHFGIFVTIYDLIRPWGLRTTVESEEVGYRDTPQTINGRKLRRQLRASAEFENEISPARIQQLSAEFSFNGTVGDQVIKPGSKTCLDQGEDGVRSGKLGRG